jgi:hypothetical protein
MVVSHQATIEKRSSPSSLRSNNAKLSPCFAGYLVGEFSLRMSAVVALSYFPNDRIAAKRRHSSGGTLNELAAK